MRDGSIRSNGHRLSELRRLLRHLLLHLLELQGSHRDRDMLCGGNAQSRRDIDKWTAAWLPNSKIPPPRIILHR